ncbi:hypothetical protein BpHYR1_009535 [Brachionus plicatilis]|uniref:Uncharacterized protein n=1 Tax=Brachionus plicatilis TaxID=10195 RepID=A0A3M7SUB2_BRAPC|nr:hypothetical protein BpHYR1_009535 [Brachionus plicatilis]
MCFDWKMITQHFVIRQNFDVQSDDDFDELKNIKNLKIALKNKNSWIAAFKYIKIVSNFDLSIIWMEIQL